MAVTYGSLLLDTRGRLRRCGVPDPSLEAGEIVCFASGKSREQLLRDLPLYTSDKLEREVESLLRRREAGEPLAYLIGEWDFCGMTLDITPDVLIPRQDSEVLAQRTVALLREGEPEARVLDLCAGSGCIGLACARSVPDCRVVLGEWQQSALRICRGNIRRCALNARVICLRLNALQPPPESLGSFHIIVCNPPYIPREEISRLDPSVRDYEPHTALDGGVDGLDFYRGIIPSWRGALIPGGTLLFEVGLGQDEAVAELLRGCGYTDIRVTLDTQGRRRIVEGHSVSFQDLRS